jgi:hypothetical protein
VPAGDTCLQQNTSIHRVIRPVDEARTAVVEPRLDDEAQASADPRPLRQDKPRPHGDLRRFYLPVQAKFTLAFMVSLAWTIVSTLLALPWLQDLAAVVSWPVAIFAVGGIAVLPGMMNAFLVTGLLLDRRPPRKPLVDYRRFRSWWLPTTRSRRSRTR